MDPCCRCTRAHTRTNNNAEESSFVDNPERRPSSGPCLQIYLAQPFLPLCWVFRPALVVVLMEPNKVAVHRMGTCRTGA